MGLQQPCRKSCQANDGLTNYLIQHSYTLTTPELDIKREVRGCFSLEWFALRSTCIVWRRGEKTMNTVLLARIHGRGRSRHNRLSLHLLFTSIFMGAVVVLGLFGLIESASAGEIMLSESVGLPIGCGYESWEYKNSNRADVAATVSPGSRADTVRVARTIVHTLDAKRATLHIKVISDIRLVYEVFAKGGSKGQIYRMNKPTLIKRTASGSLMLIARLAVKQSAEVQPPIKNESGWYSFRTRQRVSFTLPRQIFLPRDDITELLRQLFRFEPFDLTHTYSIRPNSDYGTVGVSVPL